jgi:hypothetical protein
MSYNIIHDDGQPTVHAQPWNNLKVNNLDITGALTVSSLDVTGNETVGGNLTVGGNVTANSANFNTAEVLDQFQAGSLKFIAGPNQSVLDTYEEYTYSCPVTYNGTSIGNFNFYAVVVGGCVSLTIPNIGLRTEAATGNYVATGFPIDVTPTVIRNCLTIVTNNNVQVLGYVTIDTSGGFTWYIPGGPTFSAGVSGTPGQFSVIYNI